MTQNTFFEDVALLASLATFIQRWLSCSFVVVEVIFLSEKPNYTETWEPEGNLRHAQGQIDRYLNREPGEVTESHNTKSLGTELCFAIVGGTIEKPRKTSLGKSQVY